MHRSGRLLLRQQQKQQRPKPPRSRCSFTSTAHVQDTEPAPSSWWQRLERSWLERTGVAEMAILKESVRTAQSHLERALHESSTARSNLEKVWQQTLQLQQEHAALLRHRDHWTTDEANRFASLLQKEVSLRQEFEMAQQSARSTEQIAAARQLTYLDALRRRYQEETVWQDKWRILGTYGTWTLIGINSLVFGASQYLHQRRERERANHIEALLLTSQQQQQQQQQHQPPQPLSSASTNRQKDGGQRPDEEESAAAVESNVVCSQTSENVEASKDEPELGEKEEEDPRATTTAANNATVAPTTNDDDGNVTVWSILSNKTKRLISSSPVCIVDYIQPYYEYFHFFHFHVPSAVVGATIGATVAIVVVLATTADRP
jgi:hypothetical protein